MEGAKILDKYYIPARYPNGFDTGAPMEYFTEKEAKEAVEYADKIIILRKSDKMIIDRVTDFMDSFKDVGIGVDIFPYTEEEVDEFVKNNRHFIRELLAHRIKLA
jgi:hypothetical protein